MIALAPLRFAACVILLFAAPAMAQDASPWQVDLAHRRLCSPVDYQFAFGRDPSDDSTWNVPLATGLDDLRVEVRGKQSGTVQRQQLFYLVRNQTDVRQLQPADAAEQAVVVGNLLLPVRQSSQ